jgi:hypothetical protein
MQVGREALGMRPEPPFLIKDCGLKWATTATFLSLYFIIATDHSTPRSFHSMSKALTTANRRILTFHRFSNNIDTYHFVVFKLIFDSVLRVCCFFFNVVDVRYAADIGEAATSDSHVTAPREGVH